MEERLQEGLLNDEEVREYDLVEVVAASTRVMDMVEPRLVDHHQRTAYVAFELGRALGLPRDELLDLFLAALVHDVGAFRLTERLALLEFEVGDGGDHAEVGAGLVSSAAPLRRLGPLLRDHHTRWENGGAMAPMGARVLHLADRVAVSVTPGRPDPDLAHGLIERLRAEAGRMFSPAVVDAFRLVAEREAFWFELSAPLLDPFIAERAAWLGGRTVDLYGFREIARFICALVDFRSRFTATHSRGVAACADRLAGFLGWEEVDRLELEVAGLMHDVGKLAVSDAIIEKPAKLTERERWLMMQHPYHTHRVLHAIHGADQIDHFASNHHEHWGEDAYPFHADPDRLRPGARLMAVADVFTALTEARPYRRPMSARSAMVEMQAMAGRRKLDPELVEVARSHFDELDGVREREQRLARGQFNRFNRDKRRHRLH